MGIADMDSVPNSLRIVLPWSHCSECLHTCSNSFRIIKRIGKGSHGHVFMALHAPTMKIYAIKRIRCASGIAHTTMKHELKALTDLCRHLRVNSEGVVDAQPSMLSQCKRCCREFGYERMEGGYWISKGAVDDSSSPHDVQKLNASFSSSLFSLLTVRAPPPHLAPEFQPSPFITTFADSFPDTSAEGQCLVMEYMRWGSLSERMSDGWQCSVDELAVVAYSLLQALVYIAAHDYVHRDIKPANILLDAYGHVKLSDFGTACRGAASSPLRNGSERLLAGTLIYMSPESLQYGTYTHKSDIWSLGMTLVHLLRGTHPFEGQRSYWAVRDAINSACVETILPADHSSYPVSLVALLARCIAPNAEDRSSAAELLQSPFIQDALQSGTIQESDPRLAALSDSLNAATAGNTTDTLTALAAIVNEECESPSEVSDRQVGTMADQLGIALDTLTAAIHTNSGEKSTCRSGFA